MKICFYIKLVSENSMALTCSVSTKVFENKYRHKDHTDTHLQDNKFSCEQCLKIFPTNYTKQRHITEIHGEKQREYYCEFCDFKFTQERNMIKHRDNCHSKETMEYTCVLCDSSFKRRDNPFFVILTQFNRFV